MPRIDQLVKLAEAAGCKLRLNDRRSYGGGVESLTVCLHLGRRTIVFSTHGPFIGVEDDAVASRLRAGVLDCRASVYENIHDGDGFSWQMLTEFDARHKAAPVVARLFAGVGACHKPRRARFDIQGYGRGTPSVTLRSVYDDHHYLLESIDKNSRVVRDPEGISLAYFRGDIEAGMFLDWLWDEVKL